MEDDFNFDMATKYKPEFKNQATLDNLYEILSQERIDYLENAGIEINADDDYYTREQNRVYNAKEPSSIRNKLKNLLNIDVKLYKHKSDEENYNTLKLLYLIANTNRYDDDNPLKNISIIDLISAPSLEFTNSNYALYKEQFESISNKIKEGIEDADIREECIKWIHEQWELIRTNISLTLIEEIQTQQNNFPRIHYILKAILDSIDSEQIRHLQRPNEGIIETFYNKLLSSCIIAEIDDTQKAVYDYQNEILVSKAVTELSFSDILNEPAAWNEFQNLIKINKSSLSDVKKQLVWSVLLCKENVTKDDLNAINIKDYKYAVKYADIVAEYWIKDMLGHADITLAEWIMVMQELMCIHHESIPYKNSFIRHTNTNRMLTAAIKHFEAHQQPHQIVLQRLNHRLLLTYGTKELIEQKLQADTYINKIEKIIFSYMNLQDMKAAHNWLYFQVMSALSSDASCMSIPDSINQIMQKRLSEKGVPQITFIYEPTSSTNFNTLMHILAQDSAFRLKDDTEYLAFRKEVFDALSKGEDAFLDFIKTHPEPQHPEFAYQILADKFADEIGNMYQNPVTPQSQTITIPIYYGKGNEYNLHLTFILLYQLNVLVLSSLNFIGKGIESVETYKELLVIK